MDTGDLKIGVVYFNEDKTAFLYFDGNLTHINGTEDVPSGNSLFLCNLTGYELDRKGLSNSRFIKDDFFDLRIKVMLKEVGLDIVKLTDGLELKNNLDDIAKSLGFILSIFKGSALFVEKYLLVDGVSESVQIRDIFAYNSFAQAIYACTTQDFKLRTINAAVKDIFDKSPDILLECTTALSKNWIVAESDNSMPSKQECALQTVVLTEHRQSLFASLISKKIPSGVWTEVDLENADVEEYLSSDKHILMRITFQKTDEVLSSLLNFGGIKQGLDIGSIMNNWMTVEEFLAVKEYLSEYSIVNMLVCEDSAHHPLLEVHQKIVADLDVKGAGWNMSYLAGFLEMHMYEAINKKTCISPASAYSASMYRLKSLVSAIQTSMIGKEGRMKTTDWFWVFAYGLGKVSIRVPVPEQASSTNFDDRVAIIAKQVNLIPPVLNCLSYFEEVPKDAGLTPQNMLRWLHSTGNLSKMMTLTQQTTEQLQ